MVSLNPKHTSNWKFTRSPNGDDTVLISIKGELYLFRATRDASKYEPARARISKELDERFNGWSNDHDRQFDDSSYFFLLTDMEGNLRAASRMVQSRPDQVVPVSQTDRDCKIDFSNALEYSGLWFDKFSYALAISGVIGEWVADHFGSQDVYAIYEASNRVIKRIYLRSLGFEQLDHPLIVYDGFTRKESGEPVEWQLVVCRAETRRRRAFNVVSNAGAQPPSNLTKVAS